MPIMKEDGRFMQIGVSPSHLTLLVGGGSSNLLEMFFIDNAADRAKFDANRTAVYESIVQALCEVFSVQCLPPVVKEDYQRLYRDDVDTEIVQLKRIIAGQEEVRSAVQTDLNIAIDMLK